MQVLSARCCGIDIHQKTAVACTLLTQPDGSVMRTVRTFSTMTQGLLALSDWLEEQRITHIVMESTGVLWRPVYNVLEDDQRSLLLVNPRHLKTVPGRKTAVKDSEWLADLLRHGLLTASFIPARPIRVLRDLTRYRKRLVQQRAQNICRLQKVLETANLKLSAVVSDITGASGRRMLEAIVREEGTPESLAELAKGRMRAKIPALRQALEGRVQPYHRFLIHESLEQIAYLEGAIHRVEGAIAEQMAAHSEATTLLATLPGARSTSVAAILAEIGTDMSRFPSSDHLCSWAGLCPGNKVSGGKHLSGKATHGNKYLRALLCELAWAIVHSQNTYLSAQFFRLARRRGKNRAILAVAHSLLVSIYYMLRDHRPYQELGADYFTHLDADQIERRYVRQLEKLGYEVHLSKAAS
jgi:transposase